MGRQGREPAGERAHEATVTAAGSRGQSICLVFPSLAGMGKPPIRVAVPNGAVRLRRP